MKILHIIKENANPCNGIFVVAPQHVEYQAKYADVRIVSLNNVELGIENQLDINLPFKIGNLPSDFQQIDVVVFHGCFYIEFMKIAKELRKKNIPYIIIPHGSFSIESQKKKLLKKLLFRLFYMNNFVKRAASIQYLSEGEKNKSIYPHKQSFIGPNGITEHISTKCHNDNRQKIVFTFIGRWDIYHKGLDLLCEACNNIKHYLIENNVKINLYGPTYKNFHENLRSLIDQFELHDIITMNGPLFGSDKESVLLSSDIFIQTSRFEGLPMGILEALSYGLPCLITTGTNLGDLVKQYDAGWVCNVSSEDIARSLKKAIVNLDTYNEKSVNAKRLIHEQYSWDMVAENAIKAYGTIL